MDISGEYNESAKYTMYSQSNKIQVNKNKFNAVEKSIMYPEKLNSMCSRIICSADINRKDVPQNISTSIMIDDAENEDDSCFFENLMKKVDDDFLIHSKKQNKLDKSKYTTKRKRHIFNEESQGIIKRFKDNIENRGCINIIPRDIFIDTPTPNLQERDVQQNNNDAQWNLITMPNLQNTSTICNDNKYFRMFPVNSSNKKDNDSLK